MSDNNVEIEKTDVEKTVEYFQLACYGELAQYLQVLSNCQELNDVLNLMNTHEIRRIIKNSIKNQVQLISILYESLTEETRIDKNSSSIFNTELIKTRKEAEELLNANFVWLDKRLPSIDSKILHFRTALREWLKTSQDESYESSLLWGTLGAMFIGPIGGLVGAMFGESINSGPAGSEFEREYNNLIVDYNHLLNEVKESLDECLNLSLELFIQVSQNSQAIQSTQQLPERKTLLAQILPWIK
jgi:hypothetical protein